MLTAKDIVEKVLKEEGIPNEKYEILKSKGERNKVKTKRNGSFKMYLNPHTYDGNTPKAIMSALHETGHMITNVKDEKWFSFFYKNQKLFWTFFSIIMIPLLAWNIYLYFDETNNKIIRQMNVIELLQSQSIYFLIFVLFICYAHFFGNIKTKDEKKANDIASYCVEKYLLTMVKQGNVNEKEFIKECQEEMVIKRKAAFNYKWIFTRTSYAFFLIYFSASIVFSLLKVIGK